MAHKWARWLHNPCRLGRHRFRAGDIIRSGRQVGKVARWWSPPLHSGVQNPKWPTGGLGGHITLAVWGHFKTWGQRQRWPAREQGGYKTPAVCVIPTASERDAKSEVAHKWARWLHHPRRLGGPHASVQGAESEVAHKWARWLHYPCRVGAPHCFKAEGIKSEVAHKWARWLHKPCRLRDRRHFTAGGRIRGGAQAGKRARQPLPGGRSPPLLTGGENHKRPTRGKVAT